MVRLLKLALVGRPNVGKSALFNRICKNRIAIVDEAEGVTRDRLYADADCFGKSFQVIDTGGINPQSEIPFQEEIRRQTEIAIEEADILVMVVDATVGVTLLDEYVAHLLLRTKKRVVLAVNKVDDLAKMDLLYPFYSLGISSIVGVSATQNFQIAELLEQALEGLEAPAEIAGEEKPIQVAIIGRPNVGKSTLVNYLLDDDRCVVSPIAGTTRDSIDIDIQVDGKKFTLIDTAGIRRKKAEHEAVDKFASIRTQRALDRADICILMLDAERGMTNQDKRIAREIQRQGKGCIILFNKWDLVSGCRMEHCLKSMRIDLPFLAHCPTLFVSALKGRHLDKIFKHVVDVFEQCNRRITTGQLNKFIEQVVQRYHPPMLDGKRLRIFYMAQVDVCPPRFVMFVNNPKLMVDSYAKYMLNQFRETYQFTGAVIQIFLKGRKVKEEKKTPLEPKPYEEESSLELLPVDDPLLFEEEAEEEPLCELDPSYF